MTANRSTLEIPFLDALDPELDEWMILTVLLDREAFGTLSLRHASVLLADSSRHEFILEDKNLVAGRSTMTVETGADWLTKVAEAARAGDSNLPKAPGLLQLEAL